MDRSPSKVNIDVRRTSLVYAIMLEQFEVAKQLIRLGVDVRVENSLGQTALHFAVTSERDRNELITRSRLQYLDDRITSVKESFNYAHSARDERVQKSMAARRNGRAYDSAARLNLVKELLNAGANVNHQDCHRCTPIHGAVYTGDLELVKTLLDAGACVGSKNENDMTPLHDAIFCHDVDMVRLLLSHKPDLVYHTDVGNYCLLHWAALLNRNNSHAAVIEELLKYPLLVNTANSTGRTPFHFILRFSDLKTVKSCIEHGADVMKVDEYQETALHHAVINDDAEILKLILASAGPAGLPIDQKSTSSKYTALQYASNYLKVDHARILIAKGANVNAESSGRFGKTPLHFCLENYLLERCDNVDEKRTETIKLLLESGADVNHKDHNDSTVFEICTNTYGNDTGDKLLKLVAIIEQKTNIPLFNDSTRQLLNRQSKYARLKEYFNQCHAELQAMKISNVKNTSISYFTLFTEPLEMLVRNQNVMEEFETMRFVDAYPIFGSQLEEKIGTAISQYKALEAVHFILSKTLQLGDPRDHYHQVISRNLSKADIEYLIDSALYDESIIRILPEEYLRDLLRSKYLSRKSQK
ncbi:hypothetical protein TSAR_005073 [Trichomalopsis sarcophagae]|uniref:Uncharacterized protein n=1 Tax=Trichomalopsis sarcophagae TaxID=543379 RepID=A0A232ELW5_9HYME|nr:hypothetical protein TSAR_005073 [Trichomalopsis sarcophagae]